MKNVFVWVERDVEGEDVSGREAVRMAVGLTLGDNQVTVGLAGPAVRAACGAQGEIRRYMDGLKLVKARVLVARESVEQWGDAGAVQNNVEVVSEEELERRAAGCDIVIPFRAQAQGAE